MEKVKVIGTEWCPYCECETDFEVDEDCHIVHCENCGRPLLLCDKCFGEHETRPCICEQCPYEEEHNKATDEWEKSRIGKIVWWEDPDNGICSGECEILGFDDDGFHILRHIEDKVCSFTAYDTEIYKENPNK